MRLGSTPVSTTFAKRKIAFGTWPTDVRKFIISLPGVIVLAAGIALVHGVAVGQASRAQAITNVSPRIVAVNIPGASAISQVGAFLNNPVPPACAHPIPTRRGVGSEARPGRQPVELRRPAGERRRARGLVFVNRPKRAGGPQRSGGFRTERRSVFNPRRGRADVQREQSPLVQQRP